MASVQNNNRPHQIIMIPQNLLSEQSKSFLKQRLVLPSNCRPVAAVVGSKRPLPSRLTPLSPKQNPLKRPLSPAAAPIDFADLDYIKEEDSFDDEDGHHSSRKRTNLDHLSPEERLMRRKLKNRVAAQTARDKKKQYIDEMEEMLEKVKSERRLLADENRRLQTNNTNLQLENAALNKKNQELEARLGLEPSLVLPEHDSILPASPLSLPRSPSPILIDIPLSPMPPSPAAMSATSPSVGLIPTEPAVLVPQQQEGVRVRQDPGLSSRDLTTWSSHSVPRMLMLSAMIASVLNPTLTSPPTPSSQTRKQHSSARMTCNSKMAPPPSSSSISETLMSERTFLPPRKRCTWRLPPLPPPPPLAAPMLG